jgi:DNA-binding transcriptional LysR family regulator
MTKLATARYVPLASPAYARSVRTTAATHARVSWITWTDAYAHIPPARWVARHIGARAVVLRTSSMGAQIAAVGSGLGVALLPEPIGERYGLVRAPIGRQMATAEADLPSEDTWLVGHRALRDVPRVAAVWSFIVALAERAGGRRGTPATR